MFEVISQIKILYFLSALALVFLLLFIKSVRWNWLLKGQGITYKLGESYIIYLSSLYFGFITPGRLGEFIKAFYIKKDKKVSTSRGMSSVILDRLFDMYFLLLAGVLGLWKFNVLGKLSLTYLFLLVMIVILPLFFLNRTFMKIPVRALYKMALIRKYEQKIEIRVNDFYDGISELVTFKLLPAFFLTCSAYLLFFFQCFLLLRSLGIPINFLDISLMMGVSNLISLMPLSISGLGTRDAVLIYFFSILGYNPEMAVSYSLLIFLNFFVFGGLLGAGAWWMHPLDLRSFRSSTKK